MNLEEALPENLPKNGAKTLPETPPNGGGETLPENLPETSGENLPRNPPRHWGEHPPSAGVHFANDSLIAYSMAICAVCRPGSLAYRVVEFTGKERLDGTLVFAS